MSSIFDWSVTAANNASSDAAINWSEGQLPSSVNNSARQIMGRLAEIIGDIGGALVAGGTANALTVTANSAFATNTDGRFLAFRAASSNTTAATLNVNGIGAKSIRKMLSTGDSALVGAEIQAGGIYLVQYSTALNAAAGGWLLVNPTGFAASTTSASGIVELATDAEAIARTDTVRAITPSNLAAAIGPASSTDNVIARFDGTSGKFQVSGVTIDDSNNVTGVVALTATGNVTSSQNFQSSSATAVLAPTGAGVVSLRPNGIASGTGAMILTSSGAVTIADALTTSNTAIFNVGGNEICRVDSTSLDIGKTAPSLATVGTSFFGTGTSKGLFQSVRDHAIVGQFNVINPVGTETIVEWQTSGTAKGSVTINGTTTAYNTTSDERMKENPRDFDAGDIIDRLNVYHFDWVDGGSGYGVYAQEAYEVFPDAIFKGDDEKMWQADYSKFVPLLIREIQNLRKKLLG